MLAVAESKKISLVYVSAGFVMIILCILGCPILEFFGFPTFFATVAFCRVGSSIILLISL